MIGTAAAFCTTVSYYPQLKKCWETGSLGTCRVKLFLTLASGVALWVVYGLLKSDPVIIIANAVAWALLLGKGISDRTVQLTLGHERIIEYHCRSTELASACPARCEASDVQDGNVSHVRG